MPAPRSVRRGRDGARALPALHLPLWAAFGRADLGPAGPDADSSRAKALPVLSRSVRAINRDLLASLLLCSYRRGRKRLQVIF